MTKINFPSSSYLQNIINNKLADTETLDLTKESDVEKFNSTISELREMSTNFDKLTKILTGQSWNEILDEIQKVGNEPYQKILAEKKAKELVEQKTKLKDAISEAWGCNSVNKNTTNYKKMNDAVNNIIRKEVDKSSEVKTPVAPKNPSANVSDKHKARIKSLVEEYSKTMIEPYFNGDKNVIDNANVGMFEFACWLLNHD